MDSIRVCMIAICGVCVTLLIKNWKSDYLPLVRVSLAILFAASSLTLSAPAVAFLKDLGKETALLPYIPILFKALGIAVLTQCCASLCRECGESGIAGGVETFGKVELILLALPLMSEILQLARHLLSAVDS